MRLRQRRLRLPCCLSSNSTVLFFCLFLFTIAVKPLRWARERKKKCFVV